VLGEERVRATVQQVLAHSDADETEVVFFGGQGQLTRFANSYIHQNVAEQNTLVNVRVALGKKVGVASTNDLGDEALRQVVARAIQIARFQHENPDYPGLPGPAPYQAVDGYSAATADASPELRAAAVGEVCRQANEAGLRASGAFSTDSNEIAVGNSHGVFAYAPASAASRVARAACRTRDFRSPSPGASRFLPSVA